MTPAEVVIKRLALCGVSVICHVDDPRVVRLLIDAADIKAAFACLKPWLMEDKALLVGRGNIGSMLSIDLAADRIPYAVPGLKREAV